MTLQNDLRQLLRELAASKVTAEQPSDDRLVVVQDICEGKIKTIGARYRNGRWFGDSTGHDLTDDLSPQAIWFESLLEQPSEMAAAA